MLNDVGPFIPSVALERLKTYVGQYPKFESMAEAEKYLRYIHAPFGISSDEDWQALTATSVRSLPEGGFGLSYDPAIGTAFSVPQMPVVNLWPLWELIRCPVMVLRGGRSDLLTAETAAEMTRRGPRAQLTEVPGVGHAPALMDHWQIGLIRDFLNA